MILLFMGLITALLVLDACANAHDRHERGQR